ncbi:MAG: hypothetical protein AMS22_10675 [Thiotrichales bacterium SG8_50]|jgi:hypothetical protein|nr:MAG: hypothetical protein AMS22_10675 [Thiotrichales bacterium SG8_50]
MMDKHYADGIVAAHGNSEQEIRDEIMFLERRLSDMTAADDSACEKLLAKAYGQLLAERKGQLARLLAC